MPMFRYTTCMLKNILKLQIWTPLSCLFKAQICNLLVLNRFIAHYDDWDEQIAWKLTNLMKMQQNECHTKVPGLSADYRKHVTKLAKLWYRWCFTVTPTSLTHMFASGTHNTYILESSRTDTFLSFRRLITTLKHSQSLCMISLVLVILVVKHNCLLYTLECMLYIVLLIYLHILPGARWYCGREFQDIKGLVICCSFYICFGSRSTLNYWLIVI